MKNQRLILLISVAIVFLNFGAKPVSKNVRQKINFNSNWEFIRLENDNNILAKTEVKKALYDTTRTDFSSQFLNEYVQSGNAATTEVIKKEAEKAVADFNREYPGIQSNTWAKVVLPHTAIIEPIISKQHCWEGVCYYRKTLQYTPQFAGKKLLLEFEGAMQQSDVWINGQLAIQHKGGYTPFSLDLSNWVKVGKSIEIIVRLDNRADKNFPIGKDSKRNGFTYWSGLYRSVFLNVTHPVHITDAVKANKVGGGAVFFRTPQISKESATVLVKTNVKNESNVAIIVKVRQQLLDANGKLVKESISAVTSLSKNTDTHIEQQFSFLQPSLWSPDQPNLYTLKTTVYANNKAVDELSQRVGIRKLEFDAVSGFKINGTSLYLVGTNLHQDYPYIGVALSKNAHYRDLKKIKEAGYNAIRLAHYPHDPSLYEAADELGLMLIDGIPGWQFFNNSEIFKQRAFRDIRDMIHRDRNHPSVILWEANMNECYPPDIFRNESHLLAHKELPAGEYFTTGETYGAKKTTWDVPMNNWSESPDSIYRNTVERAQNVQPGSPSVIKEYSDWEFGAWASTTRSSRETGEKALRQGLWNTLWSHNANIANYGPATVGDFTWAMYDNYISGDKKLFEWGTNDYFRLPKFTGYFFRSQLEPNRKIAGIDSSEPVVFIANWWTPTSENDKVVVLSNCEKIVLKINNKVVAEQTPDKGPTTYYGLPDKGGKPFDAGNCTNLTHPPFTFQHIVFEPGELKAEGYIAGKKVSETVVRTPEQAVALKLEADLSSKLLAADGADVIFVHASIIDKNGTIACLDNATEIEFLTTSGVKIVGPTKVKARGGIATILVQSDSFTKGFFFVTAKSQGISSTQLQLRLN